MISWSGSWWLHHVFHKERKQRQQQQHQQNRTHTQSNAYYRAHNGNSFLLSSFSSESWLPYFILWGKRKGKPALLAKPFWRKKWNFLLLLLLCCCYCCFLCKEDMEREVVVKVTWQGKFIVGVSDYLLFPPLSLHTFKTEDGVELSWLKWDRQYDYCTIRVE